MHRYHPRRRAELNEVTYAVFPAYRCEFSLMETQEEAAYRFDDMIDVANLRRTPSPWVRLRYDNPKTGGGSEGPDLGITSFSVVQRVLRNLEGAEGAFVESRTSAMSGAGCRGTVGSRSRGTRTRPARPSCPTRSPGLSSSSMKGSTMRLEIDREPAVEAPTPDVVRQTLLRLKPSGPKWVVLDLGVNYYIQTRIFDDGLFNVEFR